MSLFSKSCDYTKLKSNLRLCTNRMSLLQKKKTELGIKARRDIAELLRQGKVERSRIKTEQIVREDYVVEVLEILQTYCDLLLTRFGIFEASKEVDAGLEEAIATLVWCTPRLAAEVDELKKIMTLFASKYSKEYVDACLENKLKKVSKAVIQKLSIMAPPSSLVELYMMEIARTYEVEYEPNQALLNDGADDDNKGNIESQLIDFEPVVPGGFPSLPAGFDTGPDPWEHGAEPGPVAPYPDKMPFPEPTDASLPYDPATASKPADFYAGTPYQPPSYDATMFPGKGPDQPTGEVPSEPPMPSADPVGPPADGAPPYPVGNPSVEHKDDDDDFDELQKRFNQLRK